MATSTKQYLLRNLKDKSYRDNYVGANIRNGIALQIRAMRDLRGWTQEELARRTGMAQERISKLEDLDYGPPSLTTLKRLAAAFDVALLTRFVPFSCLVDYVTQLSPSDFAVPSFQEEHLTEDLEDE